MKSWPLSALIVIFAAVLQTREVRANNRSAATWAELRSPDHAVYRANLEAAGFSPELVAAVLRAERRLSDPASRIPARRDTSRSPARFWETCAPWNDFHLDCPPVPPSWPEARKHAILALMDEYRRAWLEIEDRNAPLPSAAERAAWRERESTLLGQIRQEHGAQALEEYLLWSSPQAKRLRHELAWLAPDEKEFRAIFFLRREFFDRHEGPFAERFADKPFRGPAELREKARAEADVRRALAEALGPERHAVYERGQSAVFHLLAAISLRHRLEPGTLHEIFLLRDMATRENRRIAEDEALPEESRRRQIAELASMLVECSRLLAGPEAAEAVAEQAAGWFSPMFEGTPLAFTPSGHGVLRMKPAR